MKVLKGINGISLFKEPKNAKSNYWLQTLILDKKYSKFKNRILKEFHKKSFFKTNMAINLRFKTL